MGKRYTRSSSGRCRAHVDENSKMIYCPHVHQAQKPSNAYPVARRWPVIKYPASTKFVSFNNSVLYFFYYYYYSCIRYYARLRLDSTLT